jgi:hypothetical protein
VYTNSSLPEIKTFEYVDEEYTKVDISETEFGKLVLRVSEQFFETE